MSTTCGYFNENLVLTRSNFIKRSRVTVFVTKFVCCSLRSCCCIVGIGIRIIICNKRLDVIVLQYMLTWQHKTLFGS